MGGACLEERTASWMPNPSLASGELWGGGQPLRYDELFAGLLQYMDIDPGDWLPNVKPLGGLSA